MPRRHASHSPHPVRRLALQRRGEGAGHVGPAGARRPGEQPRVGHALTPAAACWRTSMVGRWPTRSSQTVRVAGLVGVVTRAPGGARPAAGSRRRSPRSGRARRARRSGRGRRRPARGSPAAPAGGTPATAPRSGRGRSNRSSPACGSRSRTTVRCGRRSPVAQRATASTSATSSVRPGALVGQRRVDVAVGDHDLAARERGQDDVVDVLGLVGGVEQGLGAVGQVAGRRVEHDAPQLLADRRVTGLEGEQDGLAALDEPVAQQPRLGGLAGPLAALEAHEEPVLGIDPCIHEAHPTGGLPQHRRRADTTSGHGRGHA